MRTILIQACSLLAGLAIAMPAAAQRSSDDAVGRSIRAEIGAVRRELDDGGTVARAEAQLTSLFQRAIANTESIDVSVYRDVAAAWRLVRVVDKQPRDEQRAWLAYFDAHPAVARQLAFLIQFDYESARRIAGVLTRLRDAHGDRLDEAPGLVAALCVVHDDMKSISVNENKPALCDPVALYGYYVKHKKNLRFDLNAMPPELLVYVVTAAAPVEELEWAITRYGGADLRNIYFDPEYDTDFFSGRSKKKKVTEAGWNLPNILQYGGICADRAYYAMTVNQAFGVPATYIVAKGPEMGHAWVGFLEIKGRQTSQSPGGWNFDVGCFGSYKGLASNVTDPQLGLQMQDGDIAVLGTLQGVAPEARENAIAITDAAVMVMRAGMSGDPGSVRIDPRARQQALALLDNATTQAAGHAMIWRTITMLAKLDLLEPAQKTAWAERTATLFGKLAPDFYVQTMDVFITSEPTLDGKLALWDTIYKQVRKNRPDLAAHALDAQANLLEEAGRDEEALKKYETIIADYAEDGPFIVDALKKAEDIFRERNAYQRAIRLYERTWRSIDTPKGVAGELLVASNWYRVGKRLEKLLREGNRDREAMQVRQRLDLIMSG